MFTQSNFDLDTKALLYSHITKFNGGICTPHHRILNACVYKMELALKC